MSHRLGKAMDYLRDTRDGKVAPPPVFGYSSTIFGATAAIAMLKGLPAPVTADALGIGGSIAPVNSQSAWFQHAPSSTIKYLMAGALTQSAVTAAHMAEFGHRGDIQTLDDRIAGLLSVERHERIECVVQRELQYVGVVRPHDLAHAGIKAKAIK